MVRFAHGDLLYELLADSGSAVHGKKVGVFRKNGKKILKIFYTNYITVILYTHFS